VTGNRTLYFSKSLHGKGLASLMPFRPGMAEGGGGLTENHHYPQQTEERINYSLIRGYVDPG